MKKASILILRHCPH
uniref:Replication factor C subunit 2 n=1 Tax=Arundo donax TaxID=35708 RepID=A0A0A9ECF5_ARUDO